MAAAASAAAAAAVPIPLVDTAVIVPIELTMLASISLVFGLKMDKAFFLPLVGTLVSTLARRVAVANLLKVIPGLGSIAGGAMSASVAAVFTTIFGEAYIATLSLLIERVGADKLTAVDVANEFKAQLAQKTFDKSILTCPK